MEIPTPRVTGQALGQHQGRHVLLICDVSRATASGPNMVGCKTTDGVDVFLSLPPGESVQGSVFVQVEGKVTRPNLVEVQRVQSVSNNFDVNNYNAAMQLAMGQYRELFA
eukprot:gene38428-46705_t